MKSKEIYNRPINEFATKIGLWYCLSEEECKLIKVSNFPNWFRAHDMGRTVSNSYE